MHWVFSPQGAEGGTWTELFVGANAFGFFIATIGFFTLKNTVIRVDPAHLHAGWRGIDLHDVVQWERVDGAATRKWRRKLLRPMGYNPIFMAGWIARGNVPGVFCPVGMPTALLIELKGYGRPEHVLVGTTRPEELGAALGHAVGRLKPRRLDASQIDEFLDQGRAR